MRVWHLMYEEYYAEMPQMLFLKQTIEDSEACRHGNAQVADVNLNEVKGLRRNSKSTYIFARVL